MRILVAEDEIDLAEALKMMLEMQKYSVEVVHDGADALFYAESTPYDLILLDVMMPKISGFDVLDILRNTPETANVRIIMLTALSQPKDKERAESLGVDDYLVKSQVVIGDVVARVKHHLGIQ